MGGPLLNTSYELSPPRILEQDLFSQDRFEEALKTFEARVDAIMGVTRCIHLTDSVLGAPRLSSVFAANLVRNRFGLAPQLRCNIRVCDHNLNGLIQLVGEACSAKVNGIVLLYGDEPKYGRAIDQRSADILIHLKKMGFSERGVKIYLTASCDSPREVVEEKLAAEPSGIVTQPVNDVASFESFASIISPHNIEVIPSVLVPSEKNRRAAELLGVDWCGYEHDAPSFVKELASRSAGVLITSPNSFESGLNLLRALSGR